MSWLSIPSLFIQLNLILFQSSIGFCATPLSIAALATAGATDQANADQVVLGKL
jgi:hypothetical protein